MLRRIAAVVLAFVSVAVPAGAAVTISFYAHKLGNKGLWVEFPHAYVTLVGTVGNAPVKANFGFTPPVVGPSVLFGKVDGVVIGADDAYVAKDTPVFSFPLTDRQYAAVLAVAERWRSAKQPSYDIDSRNCVTFVRDIAAALGMTTTDDATFIRDPAGFLADLKSRNQAFLGRFGRLDVVAR